MCIPIKLDLVQELDYRVRVHSYLVAKTPGLRLLHLFVASKS